MFWTELVGVEPMSYRWYRAYPWETNWVEVVGATNWHFVITNVDSWVDGTVVMCWVSNAVGETVWLGPAEVVMEPKLVYIPATNYVTGAGPASRYPMTINVFGMPTNINSVIVTIWGLSHTRSEDLNLLLESPSGKRIILMSNVGGTNGVSYANLRFVQGAVAPVQSYPIPWGVTTTYLPSNYGQVTPQVPFGLPVEAYSSDLDDLKGDNPNGVWKLYIYDDVSPGGIGKLYGSWSLDFTFQ
jgi:hypothetical protein